MFGPDERLELIEGELVMMAPHGSLHATAIGLVNRALTRVFGEDCIVQCQLPLAIADDSEPEPDVAVVEGEIANYRHAHPSAALLVVEVADDSLRRITILGAGKTVTPLAAPGAPIAMSGLLP